MRLIAQQSNCFQVVHRDVVLRNIKMERELSKSGELAKGSNFGKGQLVAADSTILVEVIVNAPNSGGIGAGIVSFVSPILGAIAGGVRFKEAQVQLTLVDNRTGVQKAVAVGKAEGTSFGGLGFGAGGSVGFGAGGYMDTDQGKVVIGAMIDAHNKLRAHFR